LDSSEGTADHELRQLRLSRFGRVLALVSLVYVALNFGASLWLRHLEFNRGRDDALAALLLRGRPTQERRAGRA
jgi:hypothetical protein